MKINLSQKDLNEVIKLLQIREANINISEMYLYYLLNESTSIDYNLIQKMSKKHKNITEAYYYSLLNVLDLDYTDPDFIFASNNCNIKNIECLDVNKYINNPYYKNIKVDNIKLGKWNFQYDEFVPYEGFMYKDMDIIENDGFKEQSHLGFFKEGFKYLTVAQNDEIWMSITPHEIETMEQSINEAEGKVLVLGLGLGYYPYMISIKDNVSDIYIVEKDIDAINLFNKFILPQFNNKNKIHIINDDAINFVKEKANDYHFDYVFADLWHNVEDGIELYLKLKKYEGNVKFVKFSYWIENSLLALLRRDLLTLINEQCDGSTELDYQHEENLEDKIINRMYAIYKDYIVSSIKDINKILTNDSLKELAKLVL